MKKVFILSESQDSLDGTSIRKEFDDYAEKNNLLIQGVIHYPITLPLQAPEQLISVVANIPEVNEVLVNNETLIAVNVLLDGELIKGFHDGGNRS